MLLVERQFIAVTKTTEGKSGSRMRKNRGSMSDNRCWSCYHFVNGNSYFHRCGGVDGVSGFADNRVESVLMISGVLDCSGGAVRFEQAVVTFNPVAVTSLCLFLDIVSVRIVYSISEFIVSWRLQHAK